MNVNFDANFLSIALLIDRIWKTILDAVGNQVVLLLQKIFVKTHFLSLTVE